MSVDCKLLCVLCCLSFAVCCVVCGVCVCLMLFAVWGLLAIERWLLRVVYDLLSVICCLMLFDVGFRLWFVV